MSGRRSSSPFGYRKPPPSFFSSFSSASSASLSFNGGSRIIPRSSPSSVSTHHVNRSVTPARGRSSLAVPSYPSTDELLAEVADASRSGESISVTVRFRPLSEREFQRGDEIAWYPDGDKIVRSEYNPATAYAFDRVFGQSTLSQEVYDVAARPVVKAAMEGINGTVFAYGVTSSGKTHTMHGDQSSAGIIPLAVKDVFSIIQDTPGREFLLRVSYLEIYNEVINDLLDPTGQNLRVREDAQGTYVEGIKEEVVLSPGHALSFIASGEEHRHVGSNNFNLFSSRSHTIFTLMIESSERGDEYDGVVFSQLNLIDLAGSESSKTETTGLRRKEGSYINKSLLTLGTVIGKLSEGKASHIPYRDSKLTRLLQSSLSGHGHVSLICTVTPASSSAEETHNTLKFASRAKRVEIYASRNRIIDEKSLIKKYQKEISNLKCELDQLKKGMVTGINQDEIISLRQQLEEGQVKMQCRLEEEEDQKAALLSRIQRLTKLILVSSKNTIPGCLSDMPSHQRVKSPGENDKLDISHDGATLATPKDSVSGALSDSLGGLSNSKHQHSSSKSNDEHSSGSSSLTESSQAGIAMADQLDLLLEQVKMLSGEIALSSSTLKRLMEQSVNDPEGSHIQIQTLEREIQDKRRQMKALEKQISESGEAMISSASLADLQQTVMRLSAQCNEKDFELEIKTADNRILQEQLQQKILEVKELQEKVLVLQSQSDKSSIPSYSRSSNEIVDLNGKLRFKEEEHQKLIVERLKLVDENSGLVAQNQKLAQDAFYAKELASSAAVELKSLAEEITKLSLENERLEKELLTAHEIGHSRCGSGGMRKYPDCNNEGSRHGRRSRPRSRGSDFGSRGSDFGSGRYDDGEGYLDFDDLMLELQARKQKEVILEASLSEKKFLEEEYKRKLDDAKKRELTLENDLSNMWVLVAKLKKGALGISDLNANEKSILGADLVNDLKENKHENNDILSKERLEVGDALKERQEHSETLKERKLSNHLTKTANEQHTQSSEMEPVLARLKARIQEMKEKELENVGNGDANSHVCKVCFESQTAAMLLPCRHFCLCKPCSFSCSECPLCRSKIVDRIITST